eukprot:13652100-Ditylum_brightwellii.AAC.1
MHSSGTRSPRSARHIDIDMDAQVGGEDRPYRSYPAATDAVATLARTALSLARVRTRMDKRCGRGSLVAHTALAPSAVPR